MKKGCVTIHMVNNDPESLKESQDQSEVTYGEAYLVWKGWNEDNFAKLGSLETCYFDAELRKAGLKPDNKIEVLEIGFGNGSFLAYAKERGWNAIGTEVNGFLVDKATRRGFDAIHANSLGTLREGSFDLVVAFDVLEHIPQDHLLDFVQGLVKMLRPGGVFLARFPNADSPFGLVNQNGDVTHMTAIGLGKVRYLSRELDMRLVYFGGQAVPLICGSVIRSLRRMCGLVLFSVVNAVVNKVLFPNDHVSFCSSNVVMILQATRT